MLENFQQADGSVVIPDALRPFMDGASSDQGKLGSSGSPVRGSCTVSRGEMAEWFKAAVLKTVGSERGPGVRIPLSPPSPSLRSLDGGSRRLSVRPASTPLARCESGESGRLRMVTGTMTSTAILRLLLALTLVATAQSRIRTAQTSGAARPFRARFDTSQGAFVIDVEREWAPLAADRFYNLVKNGFYNDARFFRVLSGFMAQFGLHAIQVQSAWTIGKSRGRTAEAEQHARIRHLHARVEPATRATR